MRWTPPVTFRLACGGNSAPPERPDVRNRVLNYTRRNDARHNVSDDSKPWLFKKGHSVVVGRPLGARNRLSEVALQMLGRDFQGHGESVIEKVRTEQPAIYLKIIASLLPRQLHVECTSVMTDLSDEELDLIERTLRGNRAKPVQEINGTAVPLPPEALEQQDATTGKRHAGKRARPRRRGDRIDRPEREESK